VLPPIRYDIALHGKVHPEWDRYFRQMTQQVINLQIAMPVPGAPGAAWGSITGIPTNITQAAAITGKGYVRRDAGGNWSATDAPMLARISLRI
jgi:hypothetical protein